MKDLGLPYISRDSEEARLQSFLLTRLDHIAGSPKAIVLTGRYGVGKRTLLRHVVQSDPRLRRYRILDAVTEQLLRSPSSATIRNAGSKAAEVVGHSIKFIHPVAGLIYGITHSLAKDRLFAERTLPELGDELDYTLLDTVTQPVLVVVPDIDPLKLDALFRFAALVREAYHRSLPLAVVCLDSEAVEDDTQLAGTGLEFRGVAALNRFLEHDGQIDVLPVRAFDQSTCAAAFQRFGLSSEWAHLMFRLSGGHAADLNAIWAGLRRREIVVRSAAGTWHASSTAEAGSAWDLVRGILIELLRHRLPQNSVDEGRLITACLLAASMGSSFLPQAVAECTFAADAKSVETDAEAWSDLWHEVLEQEDATGLPLAAPLLTPDGRPIVFQGDSRQFFRYSCGDASFVSLLRAAVRQIWREDRGSDAGKTSQSALLSASYALEQWIGRNFDSTWRRAIEFRVALLRVQDRGGEADSLEDLQHRLELAERLSERVQATRDRLRSSADRHRLFTVLLWYGETLLNVGESRRAIEVLKEARELADVGGVELRAPDRVALLNTLGLAYQDDARLPQAEVAFSEALRLAIEVIPPGSPDLAAPMSNYAGILRDRGRLEEAESWQRNSLTLIERATGPSGWQTLMAVSNLATIVDQQKRFAEAEGLYWRAVTGLQNLLGAEHRKTLVAVSNFGRFLAKCGRFEEAAELMEHVTDMRHQKLGPDHPYTLDALSSLATIHCMGGRLREGYSLYRRVIGKLEQVRGRDHPDTLRAIENLAGSYAAEGRVADSERLLRRALAGFTRRVGAEHYDTQRVATSLARLRH